MQMDQFVASLLAQCFHQGSWGKTLRLDYGWFGPWGRRLAGNSGVFWSSFWLWYLVAKYCSPYPLGPSIVAFVLLWITGGTAQVSDEWMKCKMNSIPFDKRLSLTQASQQVKHPNPGQALLSALADYMGSSHWDRHWLKPSTHRVIALDFRKCSFF